MRAINLPLTKVTCVSDYGYRCMTSLGVLPDDRYEMIYNSVDLSRVSPHSERAGEFRRRYAIPEDRTIVTQVSWIIPEKGILDLLEAARRVLERNEKVQFVFVGEGAFRKQYTKDAFAMGLGDTSLTGLVKDPPENIYDVRGHCLSGIQWEEVRLGDSRRIPTVNHRYTQSRSIPELVLTRIGLYKSVTARQNGIEFSQPNLQGARMGQIAQVVSDRSIYINVRRLVDYTNQSERKSWKVICNSPYCLTIAYGLLMSLLESP